MNSAQIPNSLHVLIPCAGNGSRMGFSTPKQFEILAGQPMVLHSVNTFLEMSEIKTIWVGVSSNQQDIPGGVWPKDQKLYVRETGGATRHQTVLNTLKAMIDAGISSDDWVLVHDAARPGLTSGTARRLIKEVIEHPDILGGILAMPMADTLKLASEKRSNLVAKTLPRDGLWLAQTPQMFRLGALKEALVEVVIRNLEVTDEASAMEQLGYQPLLVHGEWRNLKVTYPQDWSLMNNLLGLN
jgi:2-C-methyl-D-erythritol 4-phosphate cytidylyltransferase